MMKINLIIICVVFLYGCSSHVEKTRKSEQLIEKKRVTKKPDIQPGIANIMNKPRGQYQMPGLVAEYQQDYFISNDTEEKCELLVAIAELDKIKTTDFFIDALSESEPRIRQEAAIQMKQMVIHPDVLNALILALDDKDDDVLIEVIEAVSNVYDKRVLAKLKKIAASHPDQLIRDVALDYAGRIEGQE